MQLHYNVTKHAQKRSQQRGISKRTLELILLYGKEFYAGSGQFRYLLCKNCASNSQLSSDIKKQILNHCGCFLIMGSENTIITVGHQYKTIH